MRIALLGDTALFGINTISKGQYKQRFAVIKEHLDQCDYVVANLESPLTSATKTIGGKSAYLKGNPEDVEILKYLGITHVTLANNHMFDYTAQGLEETISVLNKNGIIWYGANGQNAIIENEIILLGYCCYSTNGKGLGENKPCINILDPQKVENDINWGIADGYLPVLSIHWGQEHIHYPNYDHIELARKFCINRKLVIHGHHPHVIQGIEKVNDSIIAYSLGNFCFDDVYTKKSAAPLVKLSNDNKESFVMILNIEDGIVAGYEIIPFSFISEKYSIDETILEKIDSWSEYLKTEKTEYVKKRSKELSSYINRRKELRDLQWYLKRLNLDSVSMITTARTNSRMYEKLIHSYIS